MRKNLFSALAAIVLATTAAAALKTSHAPLPAAKQVVAVNLQGHGGAADIDRRPTVKALSSDIAVLLKYLHIPKADLVGCFLGGLAAATAPDRAERN
jgi:pimeloyl-ACP methyl ester carboxylesterase